MNSQKKIRIATTSLFLLLKIAAIFATNYYVDAINGNDLFAGSLSMPKKTLQGAANLDLVGGDIVLVRAGTYTNSGNGAALSISKSGNAAAPIVFKNYPNEKPIIQFDAWNGIEIINGASYIEINGFEVQGFKGSVDLRTVARAEGQYATYATCGGLSIASLYNGNGIVVNDKSRTTLIDNSHHIKILNCKVHDCGGGGIAVSGADYVNIENNETYRNAWYSVYANSGISVYQPFQFDAETGYKIIIRNNMSYLNDSKVKWQVGCKFSDGNGIIIDDLRNTQSGSVSGIYPAKTLVANNLTYGNGGSGIHAFQSNNVDIVNNTSYQDGQRSGFNDGNIYANTTANVQILNNVVVGIAGKRINTNFTNTAHTVNYNIFYLGLAPVISGVNDLTSNPLFINPSLDPLVANFQVSASSPAVNSGISFPALTTDITGKPRVLSSAPDRGAYEFGTVGTIEMDNPRVKIYPSVTTGNFMVEGARTLDIVNALGQVVRREIIATPQQSVSVSELQSGFYLLRGLDTEGVLFVKKLVKN